MDHETNIHSIRALERQIEEGQGDIIQLKRARNSLLNISTRTPPEILGRIFAWSLVQEARRPAFARDFRGLQKGSYNFLLVCHHWFEVASRTPELWSFWGNTLQDWKQRHHRSRATPLNLVLYGDRSDPNVLFDESLQDAVRSRVIQGTIRQVHLMSDDGDTLTAIISSLTPDEGGQNKNIESIVLGSWGLTSVDISNFFARSHLSALRFLDLCGEFRISSWDHLASRTTLLTTLSLRISTSPPSPTLTAPQLFWILAGNPGLQELALSGAALPDVVGGPMPKVLLRNLKILSLKGGFRQLGLLDKLILPAPLDRIDLSGSDYTVEHASQILAPYIRDYFRWDARFQDRLKVSTSTSLDSISISASLARNSAPEQEPPYVGFEVFLANQPPPDVLKQLFVELIALIPRERVVYFIASPDLKLLEEPFLMMPNIGTLVVIGAELSKGFLQPDPNGPNANEKLLLELSTLSLQHITLDDDGWSSLKSYLYYQTTNLQTVSLELVGEIPYMSPEEADEIEGLVDEFIRDEDPTTDADEQPYFNHL